jgi:N-acetylneuraminic acid mutarotase
MYTRKWLRTGINLSLAVILIVACEKQNDQTTPQTADTKTTNGLVASPQLFPIVKLWFKGPNIPLPPFIKNWSGIFSAAAFSILGKGYIVGGGLKNVVGMQGATNDVWCYDTATRAWSQKANFPGTARSAASAFVAYNLGYVCTGVDMYFSTPTNENWQYNPATNSWAPKAPFPGLARGNAVGVGLAGKGYVGTGLPLNYPVNGDPVGLRDWYQYDPATDQWTQKKNVPINAGRYGAVAFANPGRGGKVYLATGIEASHTAAKGDCFEYDPFTDTWANMPRMPDAPNDGSGRAFAVGLSLPQGGVVGTGYNGYNYNDFYEFNFTTKTWSALFSIPNTRFNAQGFAIGNTIYVGGGMQGLGDNEKTVLDDFYSLTWKN